MLGPDAPWAGLRGNGGEVTGLGGAKVAIISRWAIKRGGTYPDGRPKLRFRAWFSWRNEVLMKMCGNGTMKGRVRVFMHSQEKGDEQIDIVDWDEWRLDDDNNLILENILHFDTAPLRA